MRLFSKFRENAGDGGSEVKGERSSAEPEAVSLIEMLEHSVQNVKEAVFGSGEEDVGAVPCALAMEDPFSQSDHVQAVVVEHDVRASGGNEERKTIVQTVRESLAQSAHVVRDAVLSHTMTADQQANGGDQLPHAATPIEDDVAPEEQRRSIIDAVGDIVAHPVQTMKDIIGSYNDVVEATSVESSAAGDLAEEASSGVYDLGNPVERGEEGEVKGLIQTVKEAVQEVKEEMMEVVQEVKDVVMSNDTLPNVQTESITEDAGERPSMELVHTIVHD